MKHLLTQFAEYNFWANERICKVLADVKTSVLNKPMDDSFGSIFKTLVHLWDVESLWYQRLMKIPNPIWPGKDFTGDVQKLCSNLLAASTQWKEWIEEKTVGDLEKNFGYRNSRGEAFNQPVKEAVLHLFNHQSFHRGQIVTMLRQNNIERIPATDFIVFSRQDQAEQYS